MHRLHARQALRGETPTVTYLQTLLYLTQNIEDIFDKNTELPDELSFNRLLDNFWHETDFELGDGVEEYLRDMGLDRINDMASLINMAENAPARNMKYQLDKEYRRAGLTDEQRRAIDRQYMEWRSFFTLQHNVVNPVADGLILDSSWETIRDEYYESAHRLHERIVQVNEKGERYYLISPQCGLLYKTPDGRFEPLIWSPDFEGPERAYKQPVREKDFVLKSTHQCRILIPGIPEMRLYEHLQSHPAVRSVQLYPGVDRYDLRVELVTGQVDAIDVKNHRGPGSIARILSRRHATPKIDDHESGLLGFNNFFYLIPEAQVKRRGYSNGLQDLWTLSNRHNNVYINTVEAYVRGLNDV
ncbi:MAG: hypothetical protein AAFR81_28560 [Chloroflexota bacterium]